MIDDQDSVKRQWAAKTTSLFHGEFGKPLQISDTRRIVGRDDSHEVRFSTQIFCFYVDNATASRMRVDVMEMPFDNLSSDKARANQLTSSRQCHGSFALLNHRPFAIMKYK